MAKNHSTVQLYISAIKNSGRYFLLIIRRKQATKMRIQCALIRIVSLSDEA